MYTEQNVWGGLIAAYLFLGGVGGASAAIGLSVDQFVRPNRQLGVIAAISAIVFLAVGSLLLLADLTQPLKSMYFFMNPGSWIFWGIVFIGGLMLFAALYVLPYLEGWRAIGRIAKALGFLKRWQKTTALLGALCGLAVTIYTGFLLSATPAIPFWNTYLLPVLFTVSAFSTGLGYLIIALRISKGDGGHVSQFGRADAALIIVEVIVLTVWFALAGGKPESAYSVNFLLGNLGFLVGFLLIGLLVPLALEGFVLFRGHGGAASLSMANLYVFSGVLVLLGGYTLRQFVLWAGYYAKVW
jgi:formate-dependent nitrite reductase membrane component NrfD